MKKIIIGVSGIIASAIVYGFYHLSVSILFYGTTPWESTFNQYWHYVQKTSGVIPLFISISLFVVGVIFIRDGLRGDSN
ncbi:hypothetical protein [Aquibacillus albus]|uniref:Uncharacterized membrane protein YidH (DUF202 family) n=1 Tax=Aquibacillus albus TaxID=1168171 RepID=A0ABS2MY25_9BACI|nr:hypothetical protein [Aquibacillus albus]MBM7570777.1 uncharacterized membrane protein YidH (DUF202 family) [Aquibacillus albus]